MPRLSNNYYEVMDELQAFMEEHGLTRSQMRQLFNIFDRALKVGYIDGIADLSEELAPKPIDKVEPGEIA
jgi:DNA-binding ferritin-like protein (Dps family)